MNDVGYGLMSCCLSLCVCIYLYGSFTYLFNGLTNYLDLYLFMKIRCILHPLGVKVAYRAMWKCSPLPSYDL